jgi:hypothetical protein
MEHLALNLGGDSWWMHAVSDSDYQDAQNEAEQAVRQSRQNETKQFSNRTIRVKRPATRSPRMIRIAPLNFVGAEGC